MRPASPVVNCFTEIIRPPPRKGRDTSTRKGTRSKRRLRHLWFSLLGQNLLKTSLISTSRVRWLWVLCSTVTATYPSVRKKGRESVLGSTARYHHFTAGHRQGTLTPPSPALTAPLLQRLPALTAAFMALSPIRGGQSSLHRGQAPLHMLPIPFLPLSAVFLNRRVGFQVQLWRNTVTH